jgi:hypothetical protein
MSREIDPNVSMIPFIRNSRGALIVVLKFCFAFEASIKKRAVQAHADDRLGFDMAGKQGLKRSENPLRLLDGGLKGKELSNMSDRMAGGAVRGRQLSVRRKSTEEGHYHGHNNCPTCPCLKGGRKWHVFHPVEVRRPMTYAYAMPDGPKLHKEGLIRLLHSTANGREFNYGRKRQILSLLCE